MYNSALLKQCSRKFLRGILLLNCLISLAMNGLASQDALIAGYVKTFNSANSPCRGAKVVAMGSNPSYSDENGYYELRFNSKEPGDLVRDIQVYYDDHEIVNIEEIQNVVIPKRPYEFPVVVILANSEELDYYKAEYYKIILENVNERYYEREREKEKRQQKILRKIDSLQVKLISIDKSDSIRSEYTLLKKKYEILKVEIRDIERERIKLNSEAVRLSNELAKLKFTEISALAKKALEAFEKGNIEEAIDILNDETLEQDANMARVNYKKAKNNLELARKAIKNTVDNYLLKARLLRSQHLWDKAKANYFLAYSVDSNNTSVVLELSQFLILYEANVDFIEKFYINNSLSILNVKQKADILLFLSSNYATNFEFETAIKHTNNAIDILSEADEDVDTKSMLANAYVNLGLYSLGGKRRNAIKTANKILQSIKSDESLFYLEALGNYYETLGILHENREEKILNFKNAISIYSRLNKLVSSSYTFTLANLYVLISNEHDNQWGIKKMYLDTAALILSNLEVKNPEMCESCLALVNLKRAHILQSELKNELAKDLIISAHDKLSSLSLLGDTKIKDIYFYSIGRTADLYYHLGDFKKSSNYYWDCVYQLYDELEYVDNSEHFSTYNTAQLGLYFFGSKVFDNQYIDLLESLSIGKFFNYSISLIDNPKSGQLPTKISSSFVESEVFYKFGEYNRVINKLKKSLKAYSKPHPDIAFFYYIIGKCYSNLGKNNRARVYFNRSLKQVEDVKNYYVSGTLYTQDIEYLLLEIRNYVQLKDDNRFSLVREKILNLLENDKNKFMLTYISYVKSELEMEYINLKIGAKKKSGILDLLSNQIKVYKSNQDVSNNYYSSMKYLVKLLKTQASIYTEKSMFSLAFSSLLEARRITNEPKEIAVNFPQLIFLERLIIDKLIAELYIASGGSIMSDEKLKNLFSHYTNSNSELNGFEYNLINYSIQADIEYIVELINDTKHD